MTTPSSSAERHSHPSVVVASAGKLERLWRAVEALEAECTRTGAQLVIARSASRDEERVVRQRLPHATVVWAPPGVGIPRLRGLGLAAATGDPVAITEDHLLASVRWLDRLFAPVRAGFDIVGGGMQNRVGSNAVAWAAYLRLRLLQLRAPGHQRAGPAPHHGQHGVSAARRAAHRRVVQRRGLGERGARPPRRRGTYTDLRSRGADHSRPLVSVRRIPQEPVRAWLGLRAGTVDRKPQGVASPPHRHDPGPTADPPFPHRQGGVRRGSGGISSCPSADCCVFIRMGRWRGLWVPARADSAGRGTRTGDRRLIGRPPAVERGPKAHGLQPDPCRARGEQGATTPSPSLHSLREAE
ncbi:MAG: glycosyltransferase [Gemmatimonadetes bacterium]|nr:glycosyltransferase [Gemmatimonadota bacterium]